jgi:MinD superfamily P-loop ATPase
MKEIVIISGKGGTGKTSLAAALATLASRQGSAVFADCDVDAADLHLIFSPEIRERRELVSGHAARVAPERCPSSTGAGACARCAELCRFGAIKPSPGGGFAVDEGSCEGCGVCARFCPSKAIDLIDRRCGEWYVSDTRFGPLAHAALDARAENSGKLVTAVRKEARRVAVERAAEWIIVDGSPGTGCPVIASIAGADAAIIVTEPTVSGQHDLERAASLARHFSVPFSVVVNKADINRAMAEEAQLWCARNSIPFLGMIPYDRAVTKAQIEGKSVIEYEGAIEQKIPELIGGIWERKCR